MSNQILIHWIVGHCAMVQSPVTLHLAHWRPKNYRNQMNLQNKQCRKSPGCSKRWTDDWLRNIYFPTVSLNSKSKHKVNRMLSVEPKKNNASMDNQNQILRTHGLRAAPFGYRETPLSGPLSQSRRQMLSKKVKPYKLHLIIDHDFKWSRLSPSPAGQKICTTES